MLTRDVYLQVVAEIETHSHIRELQVCHISGRPLPVVVALLQGVRKPANIYCCGSRELLMQCTDVDTVLSCELRTSGVAELVLMTRTESVSRSASEEAGLAINKLGFSIDHMLWCRAASYERRALSNLEDARDLRNNIKMKPALLAKSLGTLTDIERYARFYQTLASSPNTDAVGDMMRDSQVMMVNRIQKRFSV